MSFVRDFFHPVPDPLLARPGPVLAYRVYTAALVILMVMGLPWPLGVGLIAFPIFVRQVYLTGNPPGNPYDRTDPENDYGDTNARA